MLWRLDGLGNAPLEITVPMGKGPIPDGTIVHRTRRPIESTIVAGIPVTSVERTVLDLAWSLPSSVVEQAYDSALRKRLTTPVLMARQVSDFGTPGVRGVRKVVALLDDRRPGRPTGSPIESLLLNRMRKAGLDEPERQYAIVLSDGTVAVVDFAWPRPQKAVELDGLDAHASAKALEYDLVRQNLVMEASWQLRRFSGRAVKRNPDMIVTQIAEFLAS
jgi:very-short-patch-repair endonuclease